MGHKGSLPSLLYSQDLTTGPYPGQPKLSPHLYTITLQDPL